MLNNLVVYNDNKYNMKKIVMYIIIVYIIVLRFFDFFENKIRIFFVDIGYNFGKFKSYVFNVFIIGYYFWLKNWMILYIVFVGKY